MFGFIGSTLPIHVDILRWKKFPSAEKTMFEKSRVWPPTSTTEIRCVRSDGGGSDDGGFVDDLMWYGASYAVTESVSLLQNYT